MKILIHLIIQYIIIRGLLFGFDFFWSILFLFCSYIIFATHKVCLLLQQCKWLYLYFAF